MKGVLGGRLGGGLGGLFGVLGVPWSGPGEVSEGPREALETPWSPLGALKNAWSCKGGPPAADGSLLGASWGALGGLRGRKKVVWTALGRSKANSKRGFSHLGGQKAPEMDAKRVQNRVKEATRAENTISSKTIVFSMDFHDF